jgi:hypothetical protein
MHVFSSRKHAAAGGIFDGEAGGPPAKERADLFFYPDTNTYICGNQLKIYL